MLHTTRLFVGLITGSLLLVGSAQAAPPRPMMPMAQRPPVHSGMQMRPGQDWWKIYPWSAYNAWRNPYWYPPYNTNYPYPPWQAYGAYQPGGFYPGGISVYGGGMPAAAAPQEPMPEVNIPLRPEVPLPTPTGAVKVAPNNAAVIQIDVPDRFATVTFDGRPVSSVGTTRYYVTPPLAGGQQYTVGVAVKQDGRQKLVQRQIDVAPGQIVTVNLR
jgi:uncharacterized protein (TIGR03000 family)